jgi:thiamine-monophosphate kinase
MNLEEAGERKIIEEIRKILRRDPDIVADLENDSAIMKMDSGQYAVTTDMGLLGTHFLTDDPVKIGKKIVTSNVTDLLASGALPKYMLVSVGFPANYKLGFVKKLYKSMDKELQKYGACIIGGDTNKSDSFVYSVTMIGKVVKPLLRSGAREGDSVVLTGQVGNAAAGYLALKKKLESHPDFINAQLEPEIDFNLCKKIIPGANSGIDISDGLAYELGEIARLSNKKILIDWGRLPLHPKLEVFCRKNKLDIKDVVFNHGEDYQIVYTTPDPENGIIIGKVEKGEGVFLIKNGEKEKLKPIGYEHFRSN